MKQTFNIPDGCKTVSVEQVGNQIITSFEPEKYVPKVGDLVKLKYGNKESYAYCLISKTHGREIDSKNTWIDEYCHTSRVKFEDFVSSKYSSIEKLTPEEFQAEFDKLGYVYDFKTHTANKKRWRAKLKRDYYYVSDSYGIVVDREDGHLVDAKRHKNGNYFETKEECQKYCDYMKECSLKYFEQ